MTDYSKLPVKPNPRYVLGPPVKQGSLPLGTVKYEYGGKLIKSEDISSKVADSSFTLYIKPFVDFASKWNYYLTIGKVQNTVEKLVSDIITRDWYFESENESLVEQMDGWENEFNLSSILENMVRDWVVTGNNITSYEDWIHVQMSSVVGLVKNVDLTTKWFIQKIGNLEVKLPGEQFLHTKFIEADRQTWGFSLFESLMNTYVDMDNRESLPLLDIYRQMEQDISRIHHKYASPRTIYAFENINKDVMDQNITPLLESMKAGDRLSLNAVPEILTETVDPKARFTESIQQINDEVEAGLQSSANRLITDPSAMADAREAGQQDDDRVLGIMEKIRRIMDDVIIPRVLGVEKGECLFKWGSKDSFELEFPPGLAQALSMNLISPEEGRKILISTGWKLEGDLPEQPKPEETTQPFKKKEAVLRSYAVEEGGGHEETIGSEQDVMWHEQNKKHLHVFINDDNTREVIEYPKEDVKSQITLLAAQIQSLVTKMEKKDGKKSNPNK